MSSIITWRPPGWQTLEEGEVQTPAECVKMYEAFKKDGYYNKGKLSEKGAKKIDADDAMVVQHNEQKLRDAWNTPGQVWSLVEGLTGVDFTVDPFNNPGMIDDGKLVVKLDGTGDQDDINRATNGLAVSEEKVTLETFEFVEGKVKAVKVDLPLPLHWLGQPKQGHKLEQGNAHAKVNGPHSHTERWLKLCAAHGQHNIVAAFVPDRGDGWYQRWALTAQLVVHLGRVSCIPAPAIKKSSPMSASALLVWIPPSFVKGLPKHTRSCIEKGRSFRVPFMAKVRSNTQYAFVQPADVRAIVDMGLV